MTNKIDYSEQLSTSNLKEDSLDEIIKDYSNLNEKCDNVILKIKKRKSKKKEKVAALPNQ
jgi:hypothetical protein